MTWKDNLPYLPYCLGYRSPQQCIECGDMMDMRLGEGWVDAGDDQVVCLLCVKEELARWMPGLETRKPSPRFFEDLDVPPLKRS
jgi:hypothetical protein